MGQGSAYSYLDLHLKRLGDIIVSYIEAINQANRFTRGEINEVHLGAQKLV